MRLISRGQDDWHGPWLCSAYGIGYNFMLGVQGGVKK